MYCVDDHPSGSEGPIGSTVVCGADVTPGLVLEASHGGRMRLVAPDGPLLWARLAAWYRGVWVLRRPGRASPQIVPPIRAFEARRDPDWTRWLADALGASPRAPLRPGTWRTSWLRARRDARHAVFRDPGPPAAEDVGRAVTIPRLHFESWGISGSGKVIPLRTLSPTSAGRVKSWRKHARDATLPPLLLWWITGLDMHVILDGHDRLVAARAEGKRPRAVVLWQATEESWRAAAHEIDALEREYALAFAHQPRLAERRRLGARLSNVHGEPMRLPVTTARGTVDRHRSWDREVAIGGPPGASLDQMLAGEAPRPHRAAVFRTD